MNSITLSNTLAKRREDVRRGGRLPPPASDKRGPRRRSADYPSSSHPAVDPDRTQSDWKGKPLLKGLCTLRDEAKKGALGKYLEGD